MHTAAIIVAVVSGLLTILFFGLANRLHEKKRRRAFRGLLSEALFHAVHKGPIEHLEAYSADYRRSLRFTLYCLIAAFFTFCLCIGSILYVAFA